MFARNFIPQSLVISLHAFFVLLTTIIPIAKVTAGDTTSSITIKYDLPKALRVSLAIYDCEDRLVRTIYIGDPQSAGQHLAHWDGLDRYGNSLPAGEYSWKILGTSGLRAEFITQIGQNVNPPWERATGNHESPVGAAIDSSGLYRVGATNEGGHYAVKTDLQGKHVWAVDRYSADPWAQGTVAVTLVNDRLFELLPNGDVYGYEAKSGKVFTGGNYDPKPWNFCWEGYTPPAETSDEDKRKLRARQCPKDLASDSSSNRIIAAYPQHQAIAWYSAVDGQLIGSIRQIKELTGIAVGFHGQIYAISEGAVVSFDQNSKEPKLVITREQLQNPWRISIDPQSGEILVAENSLKFPKASPHHQVKRFSSQGMLLMSYGKSTGRVDGTYIPTDFRGITDIEHDPSGGFFITEGDHTPPRRTARFNNNGSLLHEWYGCQHYGVIASPEPNDPRFVWTMANALQQGLIRWEVDYSNMSWRVAEIYQDVFANNPYAVVPQVPDLFERNGLIYIQGGALHGGMSLVIYDPKSKKIRPCVASEWRNNKEKAYLWTDLNDDGLATDEELNWKISHQLGGWIDTTTLSLFTTPTPTDYNPGKRFDPIKITSGGVPLYSGKPETHLPAINEAEGKYFPGDYRRDSNHNIYGCFADGAKNPYEGAENHGAWYYNSCSAIDRLVKWDSSGKLLWSVGRHSPDNDHEPGSTAMGRGLVGLTHSCVIWGDASDEESARPTVWTEDGLYVDELLRVPNDYITKDAYGMFNANEYPCGRLHTNPVTGEVLYYALNSGGGAPIYRITGWDGWHRAEGKFLLASANTQVAKLDGTGIMGEYFNSPDCSGEPAFSRLDQLVYFNWSKNVPDERITSDSFSVRWTGTYEAATNEDLRFEIRGNFPWRDRGMPAFTKLWLNGKLVIDSKSEHSHVRVRMTAAERVDLKLECGFQKGNAAVALSHDTPGLDRRAVLPKYLHPHMEGSSEVIEVIHQHRPDLIAQFDFDQQTTPLFWSTTGRDVFGRLTGIAKKVPGINGEGIELTARGEFSPAMFPIDEALLLPDTEYAVCFWFKTAETNIQLSEAKRYSSYNNRWSDHNLLLEGGKLQFRLKEAPNLSTPAEVNDNQWHHVVTSVGTGGNKLYLDGKLVDSGDTTRRSTNSNRLGLDIGPGTGHGTISFDEINILGKVPTTDEVTKLFTNRK